MTYPELQEFTKQVVLKYLPQIVKAEDQETDYPIELSQIARGLNVMCSAIYLTILHDIYKITISV